MYLNKKWELLLNLANLRSIRKENLKHPSWFSKVYLLCDLGLWQSEITGAYESTETSNSRIQHESNRKQSRESLYPYTPSSFSGQHFSCKQRKNFTGDQGYPRELGDKDWTTHPWESNTDFSLLKKASVKSCLLGCRLTDLHLREWFLVFWGTSNQGPG